MQISPRGLSVILLASLACGSDGPSSPPPAATPAPTPTPTPVAGTVRLVAVSVPSGSTLVAQPMHTAGQQVPELWATVGIRMASDVVNGRFQLFFSTPDRWCLGTGGSGTFPANVEMIVTTFNVSKAQTDPTGMCPLPYTTTSIDVIVYDSSGQRLLTTQFPAAYRFVAP